MMGNVAACGGGDATTPESEKIEAQLKEERKAAERKVKILLLGTGDSGKSTFAKQMTVLHSSGFSNEEYQRFQKVLRDNALTSMQKILSSIRGAQAKLEKQLAQDHDAVLDAADLTPAVASAPPRLSPSVAPPAHAASHSVGERTVEEQEAAALH